MVLFVPAKFTAEGAFEAIEAEVPLVITIAEHVPVHDRMMFEDSQAEVIVIIGEIGRIDEEDAARYIKDYINKPIVALIAGKNNERYGYNKRLTILQFLIF